MMTQRLTFIYKYLPCSILNEKEYPALNKFINKVQQHRHRFTCRKKIGVTCRFNAPWPPSDETQIVHGTDVNEEELKRNKRNLDKVLSEVIMIDDDDDDYDDDDVTLTKFLGSCGVTEHEYIQALETMSVKISIIYKRMSNETMKSSCNTVILNLMNLI